MVEFRAEQARQATQQTQSLWDMLQKGIANVIFAQLTPVWSKLMALQTRAADVDTLAAQVAQVEACRSELAEKVLETKEKEHNHIA